MNWSAADSAEAERRYTVGLALTPRQAAHILGATFARGAHRGEPDRRRVLELVAARRTCALSIPLSRRTALTVSSAEVHRYLAGGARVGQVIDLARPA